MHDRWINPAGADGGMATTYMFMFVLFGVAWEDQSMLSVCGAVGVKILVSVGAGVSMC